LSLIEKAITDGVVLNGLRREVRPQIPDQPIDLIIGWEQAHLDFGKNLQTLLQGYWSDKIISYKNDITTTLQRIPQVSGSTDQAELDFINKQLEDLAIKEAARLSSPKPKNNQWNKRRKSTMQVKRNRDQTVASTSDRSGVE
jgi:hypothetical protein